MAGQPFSRDVTLGEVLRRDLAAFLVGAVFLFLLGCLASLVVLVGWLGAPPPKESPGEIALVLALLSAGVLAFLRYRAYRIGETLRSGEPVDAEIVRGLAFQWFAQVRIRYTAGGEVVHRHLWFPNTKRTRALTRAKQLTYMLSRGRTGSGVVRDLYEDR